MRVLAVTMEVIMSKFLRKYFLIIVLIPMFILCVAASYARFIVEEDYLVSYRTSCDPHTESCFTECSDEACSKPEYYQIMEKYAPDLKAQCGKDITDCEEANYCYAGESQCTLTLCDPAVDGADTCNFKVSRD